MNLRDMHDFWEDGLLPSHQSKYQMLSNNNIDWDRYAELLVRQKGRCLICLRKPSGSEHLFKWLQVDRHPSTDQIMGLLCSECRRCVRHLTSFYDRWTVFIQYMQSEGRYLFRAEEEDLSDLVSPADDGETRT